MMSFKLLLPCDQPELFNLILLRLELRSNQRMLNLHSRNYCYKIAQYICTKLYMPNLDRVKEA